MSATNDAVTGPKGASGLALLFCRRIPMTSLGVIVGGGGAGGSVVLRGHGPSARDDVAVVLIARRSLLDRCVPLVAARASCVISS